MTDDTRDARSGEAAALARIKDIQSLFDGVRAMLNTQIAEIGPAHSATPKAIMAKLSELHTAHVALVKAEEAYNAKYGQSEHDDIIDYDAIRLEIGRRIDRIRAAQRAGTLSAVTDDSGAE